MKNGHMTVKEIGMLIEQMRASGMSDEEIIDVNIPTAVPLVYEFDDSFHVTKKYYLGDQAAISAKMNAVANQGSKKK